MTSSFKFLLPIQFLNKHVNLFNIFLSIKIYKYIILLDSFVGTYILIMYTLKV